MINERQAVADGGLKASRAAARLLTMRARALLGDAETILDHAGDRDAAKVATTACEGATALIAATYDGTASVFACKR